MKPGTPSSPRVLALSVRPAPGVPPRVLSAARAGVGLGLEGDHGAGGRRGVTLLAREAWAAALEELGVDLPWTARRANVLVEGLELLALVGRRVSLGALELEILGETRPCAQMDEACPGLRRALEPGGRGGVYGRVLVAGEIRAGDRALVMES